MAVSDETVERGCDDGRDFEEFDRSFSRLLVKARLAVVRGTLAAGLAFGMGAFVVLLLAQRSYGYWRFYPLASFVLFWLAVCGASIFSIFRCPLPVKSRDAFARALDRALGGNLIEAALEFSQRDERIRAYSPILIAMTVRRACRKLCGSDWRAMLAGAARPSWAAAAVLLGIAAILSMSLFSSDSVKLITAISDPSVSFRYPYKPNIVALEEDLSVFPGDSVTVEAANFGTLAGNAILLASTVPGVWKRISVGARRVDSEGEIPLSVYRHTFRDVREETVWKFSLGGVSTSPRRIGIIHRPVLNRICAYLNAPTYTGAKPDTLDPLTGRIAAVAGTRVELVGEASKKLRSARLAFASGRRMPLVVGGALFRGSFRVASDDTFTVDLMDDYGLTNDHAVAYSIAALEDRAPVVELFLPEDGAQVPRSLEVDLVYRASDDYGISRIVLRFMLEGKDEQFRELVLPLPHGSPTDIEGLNVWSLENVNLFPGDRIIYYLEAKDNNVATGPGVSRTPTRRLVVPSISEMYARIHEQQENPQEELSAALKEGREVQEQLRKLSDALKTDTGLDWGKRREGEQIIQKQKALGEKLSRAADELGKSLETIERNMAISREIAEKLEEINRLVRRIEDEDLRRAIEGLQKIMQNIGAQELESAMKALELDTQSLLDSMQRTIELLEQALREQRMDELVRRAEDMLAEQRSLRDSTASGDLDDLSRREKQLAEESRRYEKDLESFKADSGDSALAAELKSIVRQMKESEVSDDMEKAAGQLSCGDREGAMCSQQNAANDLLSLFSRLSQCQMSFGMALDRETARAIERMAREIIEASRLQESLVARLTPGSNADRGQLVFDQMVLNSAVERIAKALYSTGRKSMAISPAALAHLGGAKVAIEKTLRSMEEQRPREAFSTASVALGSMNLAAIELLRSSSSEGGAGGSAREKLRRVLERQMSLGQELMRLFELGKADGLSMEERAQMARLAAEQRRLEEIARQVAAESRGAKEILGSIDDIAEQMSELASRLEEGRLDEDTIERQERILTRLLDSQRSMRERDYKRERRSITAGDVPALAPAESVPAVDDREILLRMIRRGMQERGPAEYEDLIKAYFRAISERLREEIK